MTRILVIDDEPMNHQLVGKALASLDCQISYAEDGTRGIAQANILHPDRTLSSLT